MLPAVDSDKYLALRNLLHETDAIASTWIESVTEGDIALGISHLQASYQDQLVHCDWYLAYYSIIGIQINCSDSALTLSWLGGHWPTAHRCKERAFQLAIIKDQLDALQARNALETHLCQYELVTPEQSSYLPGLLRPIKVYLVTVAFDADQFKFRESDKTELGYYALIILDITHHFSLLSFILYFLL